MCLNVTSLMTVTLLVTKSVTIVNLKCRFRFFVSVCAKEPSSPFLCLDTSYIVALLQDGFGFNNERTLFVSTLLRRIHHQLQINYVGRRKARHGSKRKDVFNPLTPRVKPWVMQGFLTFDSMDHSLEGCGAVLYYGAVCFSVYPVCNLKLISFGLVTVRSEGVKI